MRNTVKRNNFESKIMKQKYITLILLSTVLLAFTNIVEVRATEVDTTKVHSWKFQPLPKTVQTNFFKKKLAAHVLVDPGYRIWGLAVIQWPDGKYHGYYARWHESLGHNAWISHCEIAHAISDKPEGPFKFENVVLNSRNLKGWDVINAHNPAICVVDGKIYLYYISNDLKGKYEKDTGGEYPERPWFVKNHKMVRNSQRIGVAIASNPSGPFIRSKNPVVEPHGVFKNIAVNPAVVYVNGTYVMIMKGDALGNENWFRIQLVGHSTQPEGPFEFVQKPVYNKVQTEDAGIWYDKLAEQFYMTCHVMGKPDLALFTSSDSYNWKLADTPLFMKKEIVLDDGTVWKPERLERPFILTDEQGKPIVLYIAISDQGINGNIAIPIK